MPRERNPNQAQGQYDVASARRNQPVFPLYIGEVMDIEDAEVLHRVSVYIPEMGGLRFAGDLNKSTKEDTRNWILCQVISPLLASTSRADTGSGNTYEETQKSYGLFLPIPDIHVTVIVGFPGGDISQGIVLGTIPDQNRTFTIPGIPWTTTTNEKGTASVDYPGAERNYRHEDHVETHRPVHDPMTRHLIKQGLLLDGIRGTSTSGTHRAYPYPTKAYGITTPAQHQFVMDDGSSETGDKSWWNPKPGTVGQHNSLIRFRTQSGAQILLHDTEKLIYIITSDGESWVELSDAKGHRPSAIDVYSRGDISINSEKSINFRAEDRISFEAGKEICIKSLGAGGIKIETGYKSGGSIDIAADVNYNVTADQDGNIFCSGNYKETAQRIDMNGPPAKKAKVKRPFTIASNKKVTESIANRVPEHEPWESHFIEKPTVVMPYGAPKPKKQHIAPEIAKDEAS